MMTMTTTNPLRAPALVLSPPAKTMAMPPSPSSRPLPGPGPELLPTTTTIITSASLLTTRTTVSIDNDIGGNNNNNNSHNTFRSFSFFGQGRMKLVASALAFCALGVLHQMQSLQTLSPQDVIEQQKPRHHMMGQTLYIPTLEFTAVTGTNKQQRSSTAFDCSKPVKDLEWEWYNQNNNNNNNSVASPYNNTKNSSDDRIKMNPKKTKPRLLIAISSGFDNYAEMLQLSAQLAKLYAHTHNATLVVLQGTAFAPDGCTPPALHTTLNKIRLLFLAIDQSDQYDQVLLLEADTLIVNMDFDITSLLSSPQDLIAAQPIRQGDSRTTPERHQINAGITLWNLHHPQCKSVALHWFEGATQAVLKGTYTGDQRYLQAALQHQSKSIRLLDQEFAYDQGTVIKHFFSHSSTWPDRKRKMELAAHKVCETYNCTLP